MRRKILKKASIAKTKALRRAKKLIPLTKSPKKQNFSFTAV